MRNRYITFLATVIFLVISLCSSALVKAQSRKLPSFQITQASGQVLKKENLPADRPVLLIYFSPDCDHCHVLMRDYFRNAKDFEKASVVMVTFLPKEKVAEFSKFYNVQHFPNLFVGTEGTTFFVRNHYRLATMPFAALHDKGGNLVASYARDIPVKELADKLRRLN